jgi:hypothetical protein
MLVFMSPALKVIDHSCKSGVGVPLILSPARWRAHSRVAEGAFCDGLEECGFADVGEADLGSV